RFSAQVIAPRCIPLIAYPAAWSPGLQMPIMAKVVYLDTATSAGLEPYRGKLRGAIVLVGEPRPLTVPFGVTARRLTEEDLLGYARAAADSPRPPAEAPPTPASRPDVRPLRPDEILGFLARQGAALVVRPSPEGDGDIVLVGGAEVPSADPRVR